MPRIRRLAGRHQAALAVQCLLGENLTQRFVIPDGEPGRGKSQYGSVLSDGTPGWLPASM